MQRWTVRTVRNVVVQSVVGKVLALLLALGLVLPSYASAVALARVRSRRRDTLRVKDVLSFLFSSAGLSLYPQQMSPIPSLETPPLSAAPGLPPAWGASANVYGGMVNLANGNLTLQVPLVGWENGISFSLVFNSQANPSQPSPIAPKWTHNWNVFVEVSADLRQAIVQEGDGLRWVYRDTDLDGVYTPPAGTFDRLMREADGRYVLIRKGSGMRWLFGASGTIRRLEQVVDAYGRATSLVYGEGRLTQVVDRYGRALSLTYSGGRLWKVQDFTGREWELVYEGVRLQKVRYPAVEDEGGQLRVYEVVWGYNSRGNVVSWQDRLGQVWRYEYLLRFGDALKGFRDPTGNQWVAVYNRLSVVGSNEQGSSRWIDPTGVWVEYGFAPPAVVRITRGGNATSARLTTRLWYNGQYQVIKRQDAGGLVWEWGYAGDGNLLWSKEPNGAQTTYTYYPNSDDVWKVTNALGHVWEYSYTRYGDVKSVKDPEGATVEYVYDYELGEPAYGQVRKVVDALSRETVYEYYPADDANLARRGQVKRVVVPGGFWREFDYGRAGWLVRRAVQVASDTEITTYTYDTWGRLRVVDYPRSGDVRMGFDGESRRVWVEDGVGHRAYTYDAWGRVVRQEGCCQSEPGIDVVAVEAAYDDAGRRTELREITQGGTPRVRYTFYDGLGRVRAVGLTNFPEVGNVLYHYDSAGRLWKEQFPNNTYLVHTYYGEETPDQRGRRKSLQLCVGDCTAVDAEGNLLGTSVLGYEYRCDRLGRVVWSRELPSGDETEYVYSPAGRLVYEARGGM